MFHAGRHIFDGAEAVDRHAFPPRAVPASASPAALCSPSAASTTTRSSSTADAAAACSHHPPSFLASLHRCRGGETPSVLPSSSGPAPLLQLPLFLHPLLPSLPPVDWLTPLLCALAYPPRQSTHSVAEPRFTGEPLWNHGGQMRERERGRGECEYVLSCPLWGSDWTLGKGVRRWWEGEVV